MDVEYNIYALFNEQLRRHIGDLFQFNDKLMNIFINNLGM